MPSNDLFGWACTYAEDGYRVFPVTPEEKIPLGRLVPHGCKDATTDQDTLRVWWEAEPLANVGVATGNGLVVLDVDGAPGRESLDAIIEKIGDPPETILVETGGGGLHYWFRARDGEEYRNATRWRGWPGIDLRGDGGYVVAPPSRHKSGRNYVMVGGADVASTEWLSQIPTHPDARKQEVPRTLGAATTSDIPNSYARAAFERECGRLSIAAPGTRNDQLNRSAFSLGQLVASGALDEGTVRDGLTRAAAACGLEDREIDRTITSGLARGLQEPRQIVPRQARPSTRNGTPTPGRRAQLASTDRPTKLPLTDMGNARRLIVRHGQNVLYCELEARWYEWDGCRWGPDETLHIFQLAKDVVYGIRAEAANEEDQDARAELLKWAKASQSRRSIEAMVALSRDEVPVTPDELDRDPWLLNTKNGIIDLHTGAIKPHNRDEYITKLAPVDYDSGNACPEWLAFLERVLPDPAVREYVQRAIGYSLTGSTVEQCMFIVYGTGRNGKSTFLETIGTMLGDYRMETPTSTLMSSKRDDDGGPRNDVARLKGARMVTAMEAEEGRRLAESRIKELCGGDMISARFLHREFFQFRPTHKLWLRANHKPIVRGTDEGIWRRIKLIPFMEYISDQELDESLPDRLLRDELPGILSWAVEGCIKWQRDGLREPAAVSQHTASYRNEMDVLGAFLEECCVAGPSESVSAAQLYSTFRDWAQEGGEYLMSQTMFGRRLNDRGFRREKSRDDNNRVWWHGVGLSQAGAGRQFETV